MTKKKVARMKPRFGYAGVIADTHEMYVYFDTRKEGMWFKRFYKVNNKPLRIAKVKIVEVE